MRLEKRSTIAVFLAVMVLFNLACQSFVMAANAWRVDVSEEAIGGFGRFMEFARGLFRSAEEDGASEGSGSEKAFSTNPFVYIAAFWTEIVNAPEERSFWERIIAFLEAVKVKGRGMIM
ncbi:MAG: hypothetical protein WCS47_02105 [Thermovirgaceae bacterium]|jgi:hypothetical protein|nr:hypothetical protein [Synergistales bacterium]MDI9393351.1 hypothetical protein [Synergistota bacterium]MDY0178440.1 hypothetical protein [Synergistaceae bacterium]HRW87420.1 hypothetical protein [Thermovirgaceae bacterium]MDD3133074.1 hypothetical protein [Synergistales bacterium]